MRPLIGIEGSGVTGLWWFYTDRQNRHDCVFVLPVRCSHQASAGVILTLCFSYELCRDLILSLGLPHEPQ